MAKLCKKKLHRMTEKNTYSHPSKGDECRQCRREYMAAWMREKRMKDRLARGR